MLFHKYHALGNDYLVLDPREVPALPLTPQIVRLCHRNFGVGSDGILYGPLASDLAPFALKIFNPDGSEAEKSGNGLRIFSRYLWDTERVRDAEFAMETAGGIVQACVLDQGRTVRVAMGQVRFSSRDIPVTGPARDVLREPVAIEDRTFEINAATIGNPHCVVFVREADEPFARKYGPLLENHPMFPRRTNVQFAEVRDRRNLRIEIWERGAGYTLASGSSSSAAAAVAHKLGLCDANLEVHMPGGTLKIEIAPDYSITMTGPVTRVCDGSFAPEAF